MSHQANSSASGADLMPLPRRWRSTCKRAVRDSNSHVPSSLPPSSSFQVAHFQDQFLANGRSIRTVLAPHVRPRVHRDRYAGAGLRKKYLGDRSSSPSWRRQETRVIVRVSRQPGPWSSVDRCIPPLLLCSLCGMYHTVRDFQTRNVQASLRVTVLILNPLGSALYFIIGAMTLSFGLMVSQKVIQLALGA